LALAAVSVALAAFMPWLLYSSRYWPLDVAPGVQTAVHPRVIFMLLRELVGGGYVISIPVILAALAGLRSEALRASTRTLLVMTILLPVGLTLAADYVFGYFVAIRQVIFILPGIVLLACAGIEYLAARSGRWAAIAAAFLILTASLVYDVRWFLRPREDWRAAAAVMRHSVNSGACALLAPERTVQIFLFFDPGLLDHLYSARSDLSQCSGMAISVMPRDPRASDIVAKLLHDRGFRESRVLFAGEPQVTLVGRDE
jgi:hypothetical protein